MDYSKSFAISAAGMAAERLRVEVSALNIANANTIQNAAGGYQPLRVVLHSVAPVATAPGAFAARMASWRNDPTNTMPEASVEPSQVEPRQVYDPTNPFADTKGFVSYPSVDTATEMVNMMSALRSYESNVAALNMARTLAAKALEIGGSQP